MKKMVLLIMLVFLATIASYAKPDPKYGSRVFNGFWYSIYLSTSFMDTNGDGIPDVMVCTFTMFKSGSDTPVLNGNKPAQEVITVPFKINTKNNTFDEITRVSQEINQNNLFEISTRVLENVNASSNISSEYNSTRTISTLKDNSTGKYYKLLTNNKISYIYEIK